MALRFIGKDDESKAGGSPAVFVDEETGDLVFQGLTVTDAGTLAEIDRRSRTMPEESSVRVPARMAATIMEALDVIRGRSA
ncbi:hypothetical protein LO762_01455 [Actinocorallia sp. API 0066]|uniref:hypothetical protein n=1 Tax=Actinocorallia sp. API 0066 TaxID=2896846 RepID=UPI001E485D4F|nr:hypothetical protein [Actinocorallia sp. API 0066]MCD0447867.1 hypothetical protein [Actinocorallia sp. API 0066]